MGEVKIGGSGFTAPEAVLELKFNCWAHGAFEDGFGEGGEGGEDGLDISFQFCIRLGQFAGDSVNDGSVFFGFEGQGISGSQFCGGSGRIGDNGAGFGVGHEAARAQDFGEFDQVGHLVGRSKQQVEIDVAGSDISNGFVVGYGDAANFAGGKREIEGAEDTLVLGSQMEFDRAVEFGKRYLAEEF